MIGPIANTTSANTRRLMRLNLAGLIAEGVLTGIGFALLVPIVKAVFDNDLGTAWAWAGALGAVLVAYTLVRWPIQLAGYHAAMGLGRSLFKALGEHIGRLPLGWFNPDRLGLIGRLTSQDVLEVMSVPAHLRRPLVTGLVTPLTVVLIMFVFDWRLALAAVLSIPLLIWLLRRTAGIVEQTDHAVHAASVEATKRIVEFAQAQPVLRAFDRGADTQNRLDDALVEKRLAERVQLFQAGFGLGVFTLALQAAFTAVLLLGFAMALGGRIEAAELVALLVLVARYIEPMLIAADLAGAVRTSRNSANRISDLLAAAPLPTPESPGEPADASITFEAVSFSYDDIAVLRDLSFHVSIGTTTAIVGPSGSGKTTVLRLIARFWDVRSGAIKIGGVDVRDMAPADLMRQMAIVFQDVYLFDDCIDVNIRVGDPEATEYDVAKAAALASVDEIVARLPGGMAARVGERGAALSGGEAQRVSIARALLKDAPIVLLDEATSALDPISDAAVRRAMTAVSAQKTTIVVAHRLQTIQDADQILFLERGKIVERGNHDDLIALNGRYAQFWARRRQAQGWRLE